MALVRNLITNTTNPNRIDLNWDQPLDFNNSTDDEIIVTRSITHFLNELENTVYPTKVTDNRGIEVFKGKTIVGLVPANISIIGDTLTDTGASFPISPPLNGRLLRDSNSNIFKILSNTSTSITVESGSPASGKYVVLPDFPHKNRDSENFEIDIRTEVGSGFIKNLVKLIDGSLQIKIFKQDELANLIFQDGAGIRFIIKSNNSDTITFFESDTPVIGSGMMILEKFSNSEPLSYFDDYLNINEANNRDGTGLQDNFHYYYTAFNKGETENVALAEFDIYKSNNSTQSFSISTKDQQFGSLLYNLWPHLYRKLDSTEDLKDIMEVFGIKFNELHAIIDTYKLQNTHSVQVNALVPLAEQFGLPTISFSLGTDTLRRIANDMVTAWKLKGTKEGIALFIRIITTWDVTNGTADFDEAINDSLANQDSLRFYSATLASNTRLTQTDPFIAGGRFAITTPGIVIPGFFTFKEFVIQIPNVALHLGKSDSFSISSNTTTMTDGDANFGVTNGLVGNFLFPNQEEINDVFEIIANTNTTITVSGIINNTTPEGDYVILSPLNTRRFITLNSLLPLTIPFGTKAGFNFITI